MNTGKAGISVKPIVCSRPQKIPQWVLLKGDSQMPKSNPCLSRALRRALYSTVTIPTIFGATQALAQDDDVIEELIVTGSRIARDPNVGATVPVQSKS
jgi:hypothetical protein